MLLCVMRGKPPRGGFEGRCVRSYRGSDSPSNNLAQDVAQGVGLVGQGMLAVPFIMASAVGFWLWVFVAINSAVRGRRGKRAVRDASAQVDLKLPLPPPKPPEHNPEPMPTRQGRSASLIFVATRAGVKFHVDKRCPGLSAALQTKAYGACERCVPSVF